jgi:isopropylmalate/homocitrate/citramalate synthase
MIDRNKVWAGQLNGLAAIPEHQARRIRLYDTTLRDGEQTVGVVLDPDQKVQIARALDSLGVERIEAGFPRVSEDDREALAAIVAEGLDAEIWGFARATPADVEALRELGVQAAVIEAPVSDAKLRAYGMSRKQLVSRVATAVRTAVEANMTIAFFGVDGTRANLDFLAHLYSEAVEAGAREVVAVDTIGVATPEAASFLVRSLRVWVGRDVPIHWHGHNDFGLATAAAAAAASAGAEWIHGTINGMGERAGNADLVEVALTLQALYHFDVGIRLEHARHVSRLVRELAGYELEPWKPIVGENLFTRESGAVASQFHDPQAIEPYASDLVGAQRRLVLGKKSGLDSIRIKLADLGLEVSTENHATLLAQVKKLGTRKRGIISDDEFIQLVADTARTAP